jgi:HK97 family phage major capsid protein
MEQQFLDGAAAGGDNPDPAAEIRTAIDTFTAAADQRFGALDAALTELRGRLDRAETVMRRPGVAGGNDAGPTAAAELRAFVSFVRRGREALSADEIRSLRVSDDTAGGYLAPDQFVAELLRNVVLFSPVRAIARAMPIGGAAALLPRRTGGLTAAWVDEQEDRPETSASFGQNRYDVRELACYVDVSNALLDDAAFDIAAELSFEFAEEFGRAEGEAFVNGNGVKRPLGFMQDSGLAYTPSGDASKVTAGGLIDLFHALPTPYRANGTWAMNATTLGAVRKLQDPTTGTYLLMTADIANSPATTLLGRPVVEMPDMPDVAGNAFPVVFGDFMQGYRVFDRVPLSVLRDPYSVATKGMTRFHGRRRVAAGVAKAEALRKLKIATS